MAISDRINEMYTHVGDVYDTITNVDLPTNKNIQNIPSTMRSSYLEIMNNGIDKIWNNWEKVTGEGETLTLNSTEEAPMKIDLKGNTSQETTTGKNLIPTQTDLWEQGSISGNDGKNIDSTIRLRTKEYYPISNDTDYYVSIQNSDYCFVNIILYNSNKIYIGQYYNISSDINGTRSKLINIPSASRPNTAYYRATVRKIDNTATIIASEIEIAKPQIESGSTATNWEKYVGGVPSPNPDYPQDIHVVSGDNEIQVCGKNLFDKDNEQWLSAYINGASATTLSTSSYNRTLYIPCEPNTTYTIQKMASVTNSRFNIACSVDIPAVGVSIYGVDIRGYFDTVATYTTPSNAKYLLVNYMQTNNTSTTVEEMLNSIQIEKGSQATPYEAYKGASYPINLPVENLFDKDNANYVNGWIDGTTMRLNTINGNRMFYIPCKPNTTYTISRSVITSSFRTITYNSTPFPTVTSSNVDYTVGSVLKNDNGTTLTITTNANAKYLVVHYGKIEDTNLNESLATIQVEYGSKQNSYTPYGTTPIELCKIGDYQDSIKKSTGKNLFDKDNLIANYRLGSDGTPFYQNGYSLTEYISVEPNTTYCRNIVFVTNEPVCLYDSSKTFISRITTGSSFTTTSETRYIRTAVSTDKINITQLEKGSSASDYQPYGVGKWYLNKQIGKVVFDGSESWSINTSYTYNVFYRTLDNYARISNAQTTYCEYYKGIENTAGIVDFGNNYNNSIGVRTANDNIKDIYISNNSITSASDFKTWLSTHNTIVYYVLATPTYTEITDTTLQQQLNALEKAKSYNSQTNLTQTNDDKPFILDVTALKQLIQ